MSYKCYEKLDRNQFNFIVSGEINLQAKTSKEITSNVSALTEKSKRRDNLKGFFGK